MLTIHHLHKSYGIQPVLQDISFSVSNRERIGLIGPNGCGKTTLLRILSKQETPDSGTVVSTRPSHSTSSGQYLRIGYLAQGMEFTPEETLQSALQPAHVMETDIEAAVASLAAALSTQPNSVELQAQYDHALTQLSSFNFPLVSILAPLGLADIPLDTPIAHLSGGQKTRLMLACVLRQEPHLLLLDEPTNHLDIQMLEWLEGWLTSFKGAALIVSHDRAFLDHTVETILDINPETHTIRAYTGNYSEYLEQYLKEQNKQKSAYRDQEYEIHRMKQDINRTKQQALHVEMTTTPRQPGVRRIAKKVAIKAKSREKKLERYIESDERVEKPKPSWQMKLEFESQDNPGKTVLLTDKLSVGYDSAKPLLYNLNLHIRAGQHIVLTGPNGAGKTTLIRTIAGRLEPLAGAFKLGATVKLGYMTQEQELLDPNLNALKIIQMAASFNETEARNFLHYFLFEDDDPLRPTRELSFGERARLQLAALVAGGCNFLILDEPINHLDIPSRARFEKALGSFKGAILAVVHDRYFIESLAAHVWTIKGNNIQSI